jgi:hypothetical protein
MAKVDEVCLRNFGRRCVLRRDGFLEIVVVQRRMGVRVRGSKGGGGPDQRKRVAGLEEGGIEYQGCSGDEVVQGAYHATRVGSELHCAGQSMMEEWESGAMKDYARASMMQLVDTLRNLNTHYWWLGRGMCPRDRIDQNR